MLSFLPVFFLVIVIGDATLCKDLAKLNVSVTPVRGNSPLPSNVLDGYDNLVLHLVPASRPFFDNGADFVGQGREAILALLPCVNAFPTDFVWGLQSVKAIFDCEEEKVAVELSDLKARYDANPTNETIRTNIRNKFAKVRDTLSTCLLQVVDGIIPFQKMFVQQASSSECSTPLSNLLNQASQREFDANHYRQCANASEACAKELARVEADIEYWTATSDYFIRLMTLTKSHGTPGHLAGRLGADAADCEATVNFLPLMDLDSPIFDINARVLDRQIQNLHTSAYSLLYFACEDKLVR